MKSSDAMRVESDDEALGGAIRVTVRYMTIPVARRSTHGRAAWVRKDCILPSTAAIAMCQIDTIAVHVVSTCRSRESCHRRMIIKADSEEYRSVMRLAYEGNTVVVSQPERPAGGQDEDILLFANALRRTFGDGACAVAQRQFAEATGEAQVTWRKIVAMFVEPGRH